MTRQLILSFFALVSTVLLAGCGSTEMFSGDVKLLPQGMGFSSQDWSKPPPAAEITLTRKVTPEDYVDANGVCASATAQPGDASVGTVAGDLGTGASAPAPTAAGGRVGLGMTECQVAQRLGQPNSVDIGAENNERKVVLTYTGGNWPGIYTFVAGRLKIVDQVAMPEPARPVKKRPAKPRTAAR